MSRGGFWSVARAVAWRNAHNFFTNPAMIIPALLFPMFFFTAFAGGLSRVDQVPGFDYDAGYTTFVYGFVLLQASTFGGIFTGFSIARDFESGFSRRLFLAARRHGGIIAGYWLAALTRAIFTVAVITTVAVIVGLQVNGGLVDLVGLYSLAVLVNAAAMLFGTGIAMRLRTMQAAPAIQMPAFLLLFLAPVWVPYDLLTGWVQGAASFNPITLVLEAGRGFLAGEPTKALPAFGVATLLTAVTVLWARGGLRSAERAA
ncbi:MAG: type transport system permease protein [Thermoleophilaceae bacterium]|jgi:ABC-type multidrug transport system permease subunit|nr:type transport system permease protein [Thermoleophilaceae bacterium]